MRHGVTAVETLAALCLLGAVLALIGRRAVLLERWQRDLDLSQQSARATQQALDIVAAQLSPMAPGDIAPPSASDSALEAQAFVGAALGCRDGPVLRVAGDSPPGGPAMASFITPPQAGDRLLALDDASEPERWAERTITDVIDGGTACAFLARGEGFTLRLDSLVAGQPLAPVRVTRRERFSLYRSGDGRWYLGLREWNAGASRFNAIQPVAGPLAAYDTDPDRAGLRFAYLDATGRPLPTPLAPGDSVGGVEILARARPGAPAARIVVMARHAP